MPSQAILPRIYARAFTVTSSRWNGRHTASEGPTLQAAGLTFPENEIEGDLIPQVRPDHRFPTTASTEFPTGCSLSY